MQQCIESSPSSFLFCGEGAACSGAERKNHERSICMLLPVTSEEEGRFRRTLEQILPKEQQRDSIGRLAEKKLHLVLKHYFQPQAEFHEQKVGSFVADAITPEGILEIQTGNYGAMAKKLAAFSALVPVTVVCPLAREKTVSWVDPATGEITPAHKSPKKGRFLDAFWELGHAVECLTLPNVCFRLLLLDIREYRYLDGWSRDKKRGSTRCERVPVALGDSFLLASPADYGALLPPLPQHFTLKECAAAAKYPEERMRTVLYVMEKVGAVCRVGKEGKRILYEITPKARSGRSGESNAR